MTKRIGPKPGNKLQTLINELERAFDGDSNDAEHDAAVALLDHVQNKVFPLIDCARDVINNWERGDLAGAVRELEFALDDLGYKRDQTPSER